MGDGRVARAGPGGLCALRLGVPQLPGCNAFREEIERLEQEPSAEARKQQIPLLPEKE
jgi:hypothetical protein